MTTQNITSHGALMFLALRSLEEHYLPAAAICIPASDETRDFAAACNYSQLQLQLQL